MYVAGNHVISFEVILTTQLITVFCSVTLHYSASMFRWQYSAYLHIISICPNFLGMA